MRTKCKWIALALTLAMLTGTIVGCGNQKEPVKSSATESKVEQSKVEESKVEESKKEETPAIDTSKRVDLVCYFTGEEPKDMEKVAEKINEVLLEKINATITFNFTTSTDVGSKYNMILAGGEDCDIIYTATWLNYYKLIEQDAFTELTDLIDKYAPDFKAMAGQSYFDQVTLDGEIYSMPNTFNEYNTGGVIYREDLRKKYDLPVPDSIENIEAYMKGIKENVPTQLDITDNPHGLFDVKNPFVTPGNKFGLNVEYNNPSEVINLWESEEYLNELKTIRRWAEAGYWSKSAIANAKADKMEDFKAGKIVIYCNGTNIGKYISAKTAMAATHPDWEVGYVPFAESNGITYPNSPLGNGTAIPSSSKNPERAMMAINLLFTDKELNQLLMYGIEDEHYTVDANGFYESVSGSAYEYEAACSWNFRNSEYMLPTKENVERDEYFKEFAEIAAKTNTPGVNIWAGFRGTPSNSAAKSALDAVTTEYLTPLQYGMVEDVEGAMKKFIEEAKKVGLEELQKEFIQQWTDYIKAKGF